MSDPTTHDRQGPPGADFEVFRGLIARLRLNRLLQRFPERPVWALFMFVNGFLTIAILAAVAMLSGTSFIFPSLGPTAFLFFFTPTVPAASPRNTLWGHAIGIVCGYVSLWLTGLLDEEPTILVGVNGPRVVAAALSLAATGALMILLRVPHPPAGATTLIVSLGLVRDPFRLAVIEVAVGVLTVQAIVINRLAGIDYPLWAKRAPPSPPKSPSG
jgi:CBS-domain-containing membrane protein